jgi:hypothetical protein
MTEKIFRWRFYKCKEYYIEILDTLENPWENSNNLPSGILLFVLEYQNKNSIKRLRNYLLKILKVSENNFATWSNI